MYKLNNEFQKLNAVLNCVRDCREKPTARLFRRCEDLQRKPDPCCNLPVGGQASKK